MDFPSVETREVEWEGQSRRVAARGHGGKGGEARGSTSEEESGREGKAGPWGTSCLGIIMEQPTIWLQAGRLALGVWEGL